MIVSAAQGYAIRYHDTCIAPVKAKTPAHHQFYTYRNQDDFDRFVYLAGKIENAVKTGIFLPVESCMNCSECPYGSRCKAVHRKAG